MVVFALAEFDLQVRVTEPALNNLEQKSMSRHFELTFKFNRLDRIRKLLMRK